MLLKYINSQRSYKKLRKTKRLYRKIRKPLQKREQHWGEKLALRN